MVVKLMAVPPKTNSNVYMRKDVYDKDEDEIVDKAEAIREVATLPETGKVGEMVLLKSDGHCYIGVKKT